MAFPPLNEQMDVIRRGLEEIISEEELEKKLTRSLEDGKPLTVKQGFDPTAPDIHLGHTVSIQKLRDFQQLGHRVVFLIGDFTAMIGDPTGRNETRKRMTREEVLENAETYKKQVFKILDPEKTVVDFNSRWLGKLGVEGVLELCGLHTVARMLERDDFARRYEEGRSISILEFLYPLFQGYDSVALEADVEFGGTDQKFNLLVGRELQRHWKQEPQVVLTVPLLVGTDGTMKMSKSYGNYVGIDEKAEEMYGKLLSIPDELIHSYFELVSRVSMERLEQIREELTSAEAKPRDLKHELALEVTALYHGHDGAAAARAHFERVFVQKDRPEDVPEHRISAGGEPVWLPGLLRKIGLVSSSSEANRMIRQGAVTIDDEKVGNTDHKLEPRGTVFVRVGKRRFARVIFTED
ncbi:MAG: tyrosine--tRNA ligase [Candidatus Glassbacteria bacterium]|nr:tyrosine--tRNA ligase [Candidatus Glassbacteria bacterium]